jgi:CRP/FNR family transcriptional regulator, cyclic AMP receptor protein
MAARKRGPKVNSKMAPDAPSKRNFSGILPNLPVQFSGRLLAGAKAQLLAENEVLFQAGDVAGGCYRLEQGLLKVSIASPQGDERILTILGPGSIVGELAVIDGLPRSATVIAIRDCKLSFISREAFTNCLREFPEIYSDLVVTLVSRLREADEAMAAASFLTVKARVARAMLELAEHLGRETESGRIMILHKIRQSDIAAMAGVARENVSRTLTDWKRRGLISQSSSYYFIDDKRKMLRETEDLA